MRINELQSGDLPQQKFGEIMMQIEAIASQAIEAYRQTNEFLYRGIHTPKEFILGNPPSNRMPLATPKDIQILVDDKLRAEGFVALRSNSIFGTSRQYQARTYGPTFIIFPYNGFKFTWSPKIKDLTEDYTLFDSRGGPAIFREKFADMPPAEFVKLLGFRNTGFEEALRSGKEVYIHSRYISIASKQYEQQIREILGMPANIFRNRSQDDEDSYEVE